MSTLASMRVDIVEGPARHLHDFIGGEPAVAGASHALEPFFKLADSSTFLRIIGVDFLNHNSTVLICDIELGRCRDAGAFANGLRNGDLAFAGNPHGNTPPVLLALKREQVKNESVELPHAVPGDGRGRSRWQ